MSMDKFRMDKRIELEARGRLPAQIKELNLDNCRSTTIVGLTDEYVKLEVLSLINVNLTSLKGFPKLPSLRKLELSDNRISSGLNLLTTSPRLSSLNLSNNRIAEFSTLEPLKDLSKLKNLDLFNNEVSSVENYRARVFELIPSLKYLDGFDIKDNEAEESDEDDRNGNDENESESDGEGEGEGEVSDEFDEEDEDELSLSAVYNENLGEESSEDEFAVSYEEAEDEEETVDEEEGVNEGGEASGDEENQEAEGGARGKKRKHEEEGAE